MTNSREVIVAETQGQNVIFKCVEFGEIDLVVVESLLDKAETETIE